MPSFLRSFLAVLAGLLTMFAIVIVLTVLCVALLHLKSGNPTPGYLAIDIVYSFAAAALAGWVTARLAPSRPFHHGVILATVVFLMGILSYRQYSGSQPGWYQVLMTVAPPVFVLVGAWARRPPTHP